MLLLRLRYDTDFIDKQNISNIRCALIIPLWHPCVI
jgi:hypothetical protein